jgi:hypothetical protein
MEDAGYYYSSLRRRLQGRLLYPFVLVVLVAAALIWSGSAASESDASFSWQEQREEDQQQPSKVSLDDFIVEQSRLRNVLFAKLENCTLPEPPAPRATWTTKPLFVAGYTASSSFEAKGEGDLIKPIIRQLTGNPQGARNYHAQTSGLKKCITTSAETVACSQGHPISPIGPETQTKRFDSHVIFTMQNFAMAFPMSASVKSNRYSNTVGQMKLETWREMRDLYLEQAFPKWKNVITTWKSLDYYNISIYLTYEHLMDAVQGPLAIQQLGKVLESAGFNAVLSSNEEESTAAATQDDASSSTLLQQCIWKKSVENAAKFQEDYIKYIPPYTTKQRDFMIQEMQQFIEEMTIDNDTELVNILKDCKCSVLWFIATDNCCHVYRTSAHTIAYCLVST